jgi:hypothetical protein
MKLQTLFVSICSIFTTTIVSPASAEDPGILGYRWGKNAFNFEGMPSGPQPVRNLSRRPDGRANNRPLVGDYRNPILMPEAAVVLKKKGELAVAGIGFPNPQDQCRPMAPPFALAMQLTFQILLKKGGDLTIIYGQNDSVRQIRMNSTHPANVVPSSLGDSVGHWDRDMLVIDTVGLKVDEFTSVDRFGTPQSEQMHVIERYRLIEGVQAKAQIEAYEANEGAVANGARYAGYNPDTSLKGLQLETTMEDPKVFTEPLTARVTYRRLITDWREDICAENPVEHYKGEWVGLPKAEHPDF